MQWWRHDHTQSPVEGDAGSVETMLDALGREAVIPVFPTYRRLLEDRRAARREEGDAPSHRTLQIRDRLAAYFMSTETHKEDFDTITF